MKISIVSCHKIILFILNLFILQEELYLINDSVIVENKPTYDFYIIPKQFKVEDTLEFLTAFSLTEEELNIKINKAKRYSIHRPSIFYREMDISSFSSIQSKLYNFKGIFHTPKPARSYKKPILSHMLGYVSEIGPNQLNLDSSNYYIQGDLIGTSGIEKSYEKDLRGVKGYKLKLYDVNGISVESLMMVLKISLYLMGET